MKIVTLASALVVGLSSATNAKDCRPHAETYSFDGGPTDIGAIFRECRTGDTVTFMDKRAITVAAVCDFNHPIYSEDPRMTTCVLRSQDK